VTVCRLTRSLTWLLDMLADLSALRWGRPADQPARGRWDARSLCL